MRRLLLLVAGVVGSGVRTGAHEARYITQFSIYSAQGINGSPVLHCGGTDLDQSAVVPSAAGVKGVKIVGLLARFALET